MVATAIDFMLLLSSTSSSTCNWGSVVPAVCSLTFYSEGGLFSFPGLHLYGSQKMPEQPSCHCSNKQKVWQDEEVHSLLQLKTANKHLRTRNRFCLDSWETKQWEHLPNYQLLSPRDPTLSTSAIARTKLGTSRLESRLANSESARIHGVMRTIFRGETQNHGTINLRGGGALAPQ